MSPDEKLERAFTLIREAFAEERNSRDAIVSGMTALIQGADVPRKVEPDRPQNEPIANNAIESDHPPTVRKRAPKGTVEQLCSHALLTAHPDGLSPQDISDAAQDEWEGMVRLSSIRGHLRDSEEASKYVEIDGLWYLGDQHHLYPKAEANEQEAA